MEIKKYKYTPDKVSYTACYDGLGVKIIHERTEFWSSHHGYRRLPRRSG